MFAQQLELFDILTKMSTIAQILPFQLEILNRSEATLENRENKLKSINQIALNHGHRCNQGKKHETYR